MTTYKLLYSLNFKLLSFNKIPRYNCSLGSCKQNPKQLKQQIIYLSIKKNKTKQRKTRPFHMFLLPNVETFQIRCFLCRIPNTTDHQTLALREKSILSARKELHEVITFIQRPWTLSLKLFFHIKTFTISVCWTPSYYKLCKLLWFWCNKC